MDEEDTHALAYPWTFTYFKKVANKSYEENTYTLGTTSTVLTATTLRRQTRFAPWCWHP